MPNRGLDFSASERGDRCPFDKLYESRRNIIRVRSKLFRSIETNGIGRVFWSYEILAMNSDDVMLKNYRD